MTTLNLYKVTCKGMKHSSTGTAHGINFVVATDPTTAYNLVREYLDKRDLGFARDRELESIELLASYGDYPNCDIRLLMMENYFMREGRLMIYAESPRDN